VIGLVIGTAVRFVAYRYVVFPDRGSDAATATAAAVALETAAPHDPGADRQPIAAFARSTSDTPSAHPSSIRSEQTL
jgi:hypothetical protein